MNDITIDQGQSEDLLIEATDVVRAVILVSSNSSSEPLINKEATFTNNKAQISLVKADTGIPVGDYVYQIRLYDEDGEYFNLENHDCVSGDCTLSKFKVCPSIPESEA